MQKPRVGISACLLGHKVRHNGADKKMDWIADHLGKFVTWVPICPEVEMGLGVPRPTMRLKELKGEPHLLVHKSDEDLTKLARNTADTILKRDLNLDSYIFKKDSPSCGLERVKVYVKNDYPERKGRGFFAQAFVEKHPSMLVIEEGRLTDAHQREQYVIKLFAHMRFKQIKPGIAALQKFHQDYKLMLMAYHPVSYSTLGRIAANPGRKKPLDVMDEYRSVFFTALSHTPTEKKWVNSLQHMLGYFKNHLSAKEKKQILQILQDYRNGKTPLIAPLTLIRFLSEKHSVEYLLDQSIFNPYPYDLSI